MVALQTALERPELIRSLTLVNTLVEFRPHTVRQRFALFSRRMMLRWLSMERIASILAQKLFPQANQTELRRQFVVRWSQNDKKVYQAVFDQMLQWSARERLGELELPALVIAGQEDYTPVVQKEAYVRLMPQAQLRVIEDSRHGTPVDQPGTFNAVLREFLQSH